jgi:multiple sugar transport system permease protein
MTEVSQKLPTSTIPTLRTSPISLKWQRTIRHTLSYIVLIIGAMMMLFPMLWMLSASFKPSWQIFSTPIVWIPQRWESANMGSTSQTINFWTTMLDGQPQKVVQIGTRRYTTVIDPGLLSRVQSVPTDQLGEAAPTTFELNGDDITLNVREWSAGSTQVVALARDGDNTIVATLADLQAAVSRLPLDVVNSGDRTAITIGETEFRGREIPTADGTRAILPIGPESSLWIVAPPGLLSQVTMIPADRLTEVGEASIGRTELPLYNVAGDETNYVVLVNEPWQPVLNADEAESSFAVSNDTLGEPQPQVINGVTIPVAAHTAQDGTTQDVAILSRTASRSLVLPMANTTTLRLVQVDELTTARGDVLNEMPIRTQDALTEGDEVNTVILVGDPAEMALIVPQSAVQAAFDVNPAELERSTYTEFRLEGYRQALQTKVGETYFPTFFRNSFALVVLNTIGHLVSCIIVAYAFARLRAPGKNFLFLVLLATMMLPFPVTIVPVYEIFTRLGSVNSLVPLFLRSFFGNAFLIFMLRQFFSAIPRELEEAARIDGANVLQIIWQIIVPLSKPAITTVIIFTFWWTWNSFLEPFIYLSSPDLFPVSVGLNFFRDQYGTLFYDRLIAASVLSMLPMLLIFFFAQRYFIEGIQLTGMKG